MGIAGVCALEDLYDDLASTSAVSFVESSEAEDDAEREVPLDWSDAAHEAARAAFVIGRRLTRERIRIDVRVTATGLELAHHEPGLRSQIVRQAHNPYVRVVELDRTDADFVRETAAIPIGRALRDACVGIVAVDGDPRGHRDLAERRHALDSPTSEAGHPRRGGACLQMPRPAIEATFCARRTPTLRGRHTDGDPCVRSVARSQRRRQLGHRNGIEDLDLKALVDARVAVFVGAVADLGARHRRRTSAEHPAHAGLDTAAARRAAGTRRRFRARHAGVERRRERIDDLHRPIHPRSIEGCGIDLRAISHGAV